MLCDHRSAIRAHLLTILVAIALIPSARLSAQTPGTDEVTSPTLYLVKADGNDLTLSTASAETICREPNLVIITHGWYERQPWPEWTALAIARRVDLGEWRCGWCDWRGQAKRWRPSTAATIGRDMVGPQLGREILRLSRDWQHVHLVGHSAGSWVVNAAADVIAAETGADLHITFLDAYVPDGWDESVLGRLSDRSGRHRWVEHYYTRDPLNLTENVLPAACNVDITAINPGFKGHKFPWHWYLATVSGTYATDRRYADRPVYGRTGGFAYGFARSRERGPSSWSQSVTLAPGSASVRILPPTDPH